MKLLSIAAILTATLLGITSITLLKDKKPFVIEKKSYARVVSLAPSMTDTIIALEEAHRVVGATIHCPMEQLTFARQVGSFAEPNFEAILALNPDLVLAVPHVMVKAILAKLRSNNIEIFAHQPDNLADIKNINLALAEKLGVRNKGLEINLSIENAIKTAGNRLKSSEADIALRSVLIAVAPTPFVVAGVATFASEIVQALGLKNQASDQNTGWPVWPLEQLLVDPPNVLILADGSRNFNRYQNVFHALGFDLMKSRIQLISPRKPLFNSPSPQVIEDISQLVELLRENKFGA